MPSARQPEADVVERGLLSLDGQLAVAIEQIDIVAVVVLAKQQRALGKQARLVMSQGGLFQTPGKTLLNLRYFAIALQPSDDREGDE